MALLSNISSVYLVSIVGSIIGSLILFTLFNSINWIWETLLLNKLPRNKPLLAKYWATKFDDEGKEKEEVVELKQKGRKISGKIFFKESEQKIITYRFSGTFKDRILTAIYEYKDPSEFERGTFTLDYINGESFEGKYVFYSKESKKITSSNYIWIRSDYTTIKEIKKQLRRNIKKANL